MGRTGLRTECSPAEKSLVREIHAAGVGASDWPGVLERLRRFLGARVVTLGFHEFATGTDSAAHESPGDADFCRSMAAYAARNPTEAFSSLAACCTVCAASSRNMGAEPTSFRPIAPRTRGLSKRGTRPN